MKHLIILLMIFSSAITTFSQLDSTEEQPAEIASASAILFVIKVPATPENIKQFEKIKDMEAAGVSVKISAQFLELHYTGEQLTSAVEPSFIKEIKVFKDQQARDAYPNSGADNIIEMIVDNADTLVEVFYAIKAS